jgi:hypothetical protein
MPDLKAYTLPNFFPSRHMESAIRGKRRGSVKLTPLSTYGQTKAKSLRKPTRSSSLVNLPTTENSLQRLQARLHEQSFFQESLLAEEVVSSKTYQAIVDPEASLVEAACDNDIEAVRTMALTDLKNFKKHVNYALFYAIQHGSYDAIKVMFWYGASIDAHDPINHLTVWDFAQRSPDPEIMTSFLQRMKTGPCASESIQKIFTGNKLLPIKDPGQTIKREASIVRRGNRASQRKLKSTATI